MKKINVLGTEYTIEEKLREEDKIFNDLDGYCDSTVKKIVVCAGGENESLEDYQAHKKKVLRHEIIHAFHLESGIGENLEVKPYGFPETLVDWFAIQFPKILKVFVELGIEE